MNDWERYEPGSYHRLDTGDVPAVAWLHRDFLIWCGYIAVLPGHPWHGLDGYDHSDDCLVELFDATHGGLTYSGVHPGLNKAVGLPDDTPAWWFGFDCAHGWDRQPGLEKQGHPAFPNSEFRDLDYVTERCRAMAAVVAQQQREAA